MLKLARVVLTRYITTIAVAVLLATPCLLRAQQPPISPDVYGQLKYRYIGPEGNRATAVAGVPGRTEHLVCGRGVAAFSRARTADPLESHLRLGTCGIHRFAGSGGEAIRTSCVGGEQRIVHPQPHLCGQGIYKSVDAGKTWSLMGLEKAGRIGRVEIDPHNPDAVLACALGHAYGPQPERGVFRTAMRKDLGQSALRRREHRLLRLGMDPNNPRILFAGMCRSRFTLWAALAAAQVAACSSRQTAHHLENAWRGMAYHTLQ